MLYIKPVIRGCSQVNLFVGLHLSLKINSTVMKLTVVADGVAEFKLATCSPRQHITVTMINS